jgi:hypothetical protein
MMVMGFIFPCWAQDQLCPDAETLAKQSPETLADVQNDIDQIKLCVERAQLLKQLDDIAKQRQKILEEVTNPNAPILSNTNSGATIPFPVISADALPPLEKKETLKEVMPAIDQVPQWRIRKIWGQDSILLAQMTNGQNLVLNVAKGDVLPDGQVVELISIKGVSLSQNGKIMDLKWEQDIVSSP